METDPKNPMARLSLKMYSKMQYLENMRKTARRNTLVRNATSGSQEKNCSDRSKY